jgi:hypothetical protein
LFLLKWRGIKLQGKSLREDLVRESHSILCLLIIEYCGNHIANLLSPFLPFLVFE